MCFVFLELDISLARSKCTFIQPLWKIFLSQSGKTWAVPTKIRDNNNFVLYNSRFFIHKDNLKKTEIKKKEDKELEKIIESQQQVINKMTAQIIKYQKDINKKNERIKKLETYIKANMKN